MLFNHPPPWIIAHRGLSGRFPENTLEAFRAALGTDGLELDVTFSKDDCPMVIHDDSLERTTNGTGMVMEQTAAQLQKLDAGSWFGAEFKGVRIPTLQDVLLEFGGKTMINIELKPDSRDVGGSPRNIKEDIKGGIKKDIKEHITGNITEGNKEKIIVDLLHTMQESKSLQFKHLYSSIIISSFDHSILADVKVIDDELQLGLLYYELPTVAEVVSKVEELDATAVHLHADSLSEKWMEEWRAYPYISTVPVLCWTVDNPQDMQTLFKWGVSGVFSNHPDKLNAARK